MKLTRFKKLFFYPLGRIYSSIRYRSVYFFDTNFFLPSEHKLPKFILTLNKNYLITESTEKEIIDKIGKEEFQKRVASGYKTVCFDKLWEKNQTVCPIYYHYMSCTLNPANIGSIDFFVESIYSRIIKNKSLLLEEQKLYEKIRKESTSGKFLDPEGKPKQEPLKTLDQLHSRMLTKKQAAFKDEHPSFLQDVRSLSLALTYTAINRQNVTFYTTDGDLVALFLNWLDSMTMRLTLGMFILPQLTPDKKHRLIRGEVLKYFINYDDFVNKRINVFKDLCSDWWKPAGFQFKIKYWSLNEKKFNLFPVLFTTEMAKNFLNNHGNLECNFVKNDTLGNWLSYRYFWPPKDPKEKKIKVEVSRKNIINHNFRIVSPKVHNKYCLYRKEDKNNNLQFLSQFT